MTYEEIFNKVKEAYENADASNVEGHIAIEFDVCGRCRCILRRDQGRKIRSSAI